MRRPAFLGDIRRIGLAGWLAYACDQAVSTIFAGRVRFTALWFYAQPVDRIPTIAPRSGDRMQIRVIEHGDVPEEAFGRPLGAIAERFEQGSVCIAALKDSELAGFMWLQFDELRERLMRCDFVPTPHGKACWDFDFFVSPQYRLGRTFSRLWSYAKMYLDARDIENTLSWIAFDNSASRRSHESMGANAVGWAVVLIAWKFQLTLTSVRPYVSFGVGDAHRTRLIIQAK